MSDYEINKKVYKVMRIISHGSFDGTCEISRSNYIQWFDDLEKAIDFAGDPKGVDDHSCLVSRIFEYTIISKRETELSRQTGHQPKSCKIVWDILIDECVLRQLRNGRYSAIQWLQEKKFTGDQRENLNEN